MLPRIISVGHAVPPFVVEQDTAKDLARKLFGQAIPRIDKWLSVFDNARIKKRHFAVPLSWFTEIHRFGEKNDRYLRAAVDLGKQAIRSALTSAGVSSKQIDHLILVSSTGLATPSLDAWLINELNLRADLKRTPIWGLGCVGGAMGLSRAWEAARGFPEHLILVAAVELCGLAFHPEDRSKSELVAAALFADGAAAVLVAGDRHPLASDDGEQQNNRPFATVSIMDAMTYTWPSSLDVMGWHVGDNGLEVIFSRSIPDIVSKDVGDNVARFLSRNQLGINHIEAFIFHPGGAKVLSAYQGSLGLSETQLSASYRVLSEYGNMSSPTVLFVLEEELRKRRSPGAYGLIMALGPGFSSEQLLIRWEV